MTFIQRVINESATVKGTQLNGLISHLPGIPYTPIETLDPPYDDQTRCDYWVIGISASDEIRLATQKELAVGGLYQHASHVEVRELTPPGRWFGPLVLYTIKN